MLSMNRPGVTAMKFSIILPVLDEAEIIEEALRRLRRQAPEAEILVVDGGSRDDTVRRAAAYCRVLKSERGRANQLNRGARAAGGDWVLFLHADTRLPDNFLAAMEAAERRGLHVGAFRLRIAGSHPLLPLSSLGANLRSRFRRIFLGDQAMFIRRELFQELGGFPVQPLLEDYAFSLRLKRRPIPFYLSPLKVETSGRRWEQAGFFRTWWQMRRIFRFYHRFGEAALPARLYRHLR